MSDIPIGELSLECQHCGGTDFTLPDDATESSGIVCNGCGKTVGTVAEMKAEAERVARAALPEIADRFRDVFKGTKGFKPR